jgi:uncharacterized RDD family membrane protein YckC
MNSPNPYAPPSAPVRDVGTADENSELAGRGARLGAVLLDGLIVMILVYVPLGIGFARGGRLPPITNTTAFYSAMFTGTGALFALPGSLILIAVTAYFVHKNGQTLGKKLVGIKVVRSDGSRATLGRIFWLRNVIIGLISLVPVVGGLLSLVDSLLIFRQSRKCLHDQIADTIVVKA